MKWKENDAYALDLCIFCYSQPSGMFLSAIITSIQLRICSTPFFYQCNLIFSKGFKLFLEMFFDQRQWWFRNFNATLQLAVCAVHCILTDPDFFFLRKLAGRLTPPDIYQPDIGVGTLVAMHKENILKIHKVITYYMCI